MNRESVLKLYDRLTWLVERLPMGLRKPILNELVPIRELFLDQRPARLVLLGGAADVTAPAFLHELCGADMETGDSRNGWRSYRLAERGTIEVLDGRADAPEAFFEAGLAASPPDVVVVLHGDVDGSGEAHLDLARERLSRCDEISGARRGIVAVSFGRDAQQSVTRLSALLNSHREFSQRELRVFPLQSAGEASEAICLMLPNCAQLEFARMTLARGAQVAIASSLLKSFTGVCGVIGLQPIPLADMPILMTLQSLMVGLVVYVSGRRASPRLIAEFSGALGINLGAGLALREGARALLKVFPLWGNAISGIVAGAGTYAIGRAAIAYFIEELPLKETKKLFRRLQPGFESFKKKGLPFSLRRRKRRS